MTLETEMNTSGFENNKDLHVNLSQEFTKGGLMIMHVRLYIMSLDSMFLAFQCVITYTTMNFVKRQTQAFE